MPNRAGRGRAGNQIERAAPARALRRVETPPGCKRNAISSSSRRPSDTETRPVYGLLDVRAFARALRAGDPLAQYFDLRDFLKTFVEAKSSAPTKPCLRSLVDKEANRRHRDFIAALLWWRLIKLNFYAPGTIRPSCAVFCKAA